MVFGMPRQLRIEYPGAIYHVTSRAKGKGKIFETDVDRQDFLETLAEACEKTGFEIHAYCLMPKYFHLVVGTPNGNLVAGMHWFMSAYTLRFNRRNHRLGHVFSGRYKALVVDDNGGGYLGTVCDYVHLDPVRAKLLARGQRLSEYPWSSLGCYLATPRQRPSWLQVNRLFQEHGIGVDTAVGRKEFEQRMETLRAAKYEPKEWRAIRRGWCLGTARFKTGLLKRLNGKLAAPHAAGLKGESAEAKAERIIREELKRRRWSPRELSKRLKSDSAKLALAARLRRQTTVTIPWIAARLHAGTWKSLNANLYRWKKTNEALGK